MNTRFTIVASAAALIALTVWLFWPRPEHYIWPLPEDLPRPVVPTDNPMNAAKVTLGRWLFYDRRLSTNDTMSCGSCHHQKLAFTDGLSLSVGATGQVHPRSAMSLVNVAYGSRLTWANPLLAKLEDQALTPLFGDNPIEMGLGGQENKIAQLLRSEARYSELVGIAFPNDRDPHSVINGVRAIASFVRTIISYDAPYDQYLAGDNAAISTSAERGLELFFSERFECFHCHGGFNFTDSTTHENTTVDVVGFHNNGLYNLGGAGRYPEKNTGLYDMTGIERDMGRFKAPSLRNVGVTAPYMHDGSIPTLEDVIDHYARGGRLIENGEFAGDGRLSPFKSEFVVGIEMTARERADLLAFLESLTDTSVLTAPQWSDPFESAIP